MGTLNDIKQKLISGYTVSQLIGEGYAKSSVNHVARKFRDIQPGIPASPISNELQELRYQREIIKIQKEIAELEASKEKLPKRVAALESRLSALESWCDGDLVDAIGGCIHAAWRAADCSKEDAAEASRIKKAGLKRKV